MDLRRIGLALLRRWYLFLPLLALTAFGALRVGEGLHPQYEASATALLVPGPGSSGSNSPYGDLSETSNVLVIVLSSAETREGLEDQGLSPDYRVQGSSNSGLLIVTALSDTRPGSVAAGQAVVDLAREELAQRQAAAGVPPQAQIGLQVLQAPSVGNLVTQGEQRNPAIVGIVGVALAVALTFLCDSLLEPLTKRRRRARQLRASAAAAPSPTASSPLWRS